MNPLKCDEMDPINFLMAAQQVFSSVEALRTHSLEEGVSAHDIYTILQQRFPADSKKPW